MHLGLETKNTYKILNVKKRNCFDFKIRKVDLAGAVYAINEQRIEDDTIDAVEW